LIRIVWALVVTLLFGTQAWSHGGEAHDHDEPTPASTLQATAAGSGQVRTSASTDLFELVLVLDRPTGHPAMLTAYVDAFNSNQPVKDARVELESEGFKATAQASGDGIYRVPADVLSRPGRHALTVTVTTAKDADLLSLTMDVPPAPSAAAPASRWWGAAARWPLWGGVIVLILAGLALGLWRRKKTGEVL
jgi:hypothetical protein